MTYTKTNSADSKLRVEYIRNLFEKEDLKIKELSYLNKLLTSVENMKEKTSEIKVIDSLDVNRLYDALIALESLDSKKPTLNRLIKGRLNFNTIKNDDGKNILFELEVAATFKNKELNIEFEEPDLILKLGDKDIGIACKKIHSPKSFQKLITKGVSQIKKNGFDYGIVAINIDNFYPEGQLLCIDSKINASDVIHKKNLQFYEDQKRHILKYLKDNRLQAVLINSSIKIDIKEGSPRFNNLSQNLICLGTEIENKNLNDKLKEIFKENK